MRRPTNQYGAIVVVFDAATAAAPALQGKVSRFVVSDTIILGLPETGITKSSS